MAPTPGLRLEEATGLDDSSDVVVAARGALAGLHRHRH